MRPVTNEELHDDINRNMKEVMEILYTVRVHIETHIESGEPVILPPLGEQLHEAQYKLRDAYMDLNRGAVLAIESNNKDLTGL